MKKYILTATGKEVKFGRNLIIEEFDTYFGKYKVPYEVIIGRHNIKDFIKKGIIEVELDSGYTLDELFSSLKSCLSRIFRKLPFNDEKEARKYLSQLIEISPKAHLQLLIENFAEIRNKDKKIGDCTWYLNPIAGYAPVKIMGKPSSTMVATVFYDEQDAKEVYSLLSDFINVIIDGK